MKGWLWSRRQEIRTEAGERDGTWMQQKIITVGSSDMLSGKQAVSGRGPTFECVCKPDLVAPDGRSWRVPRELETCTA